ncbi:NAD(P)-dependent oxidoreductase [Eubacterium aggregans]
MLLEAGNQMKIGFIGTGVMGKSMAENLMNAGHCLTVYNRHQSKAEALVEAGARLAKTAGACAQNQDVVITMVGYPQDVEGVYLGEGGIIDMATPETILIDMTTTSPSLSQKIYTVAKARGLSALDAPVSGGDIGAKKGTLSIMVGGDQSVFRQMLPIFEAMGSNIIYEGEAGMGQHTKMANQIAIAGAISGVCEALAYGKAEGLDLNRMLESISAGAAGSWQMSNLGPKMVAGDDAPGFFLKHMVKDLGISLEESEKKGVSLPILKEVLAMYRCLEEEGYGDLGTQALFHYFNHRGEPCG